MYVKWLINFNLWGRIHTILMSNVVKKNLFYHWKYTQTPLVLKTIPETDFRELLLRKELPRKKSRKHEAVIRYDGYVIETPFLLLQNSWSMSLPPKFWPKYPVKKVEHNQYLIEKPLCWVLLLKKTYFSNKL